MDEHVSKTLEEDMPVPIRRITAHPPIYILIWIKNVIN